MSQPSDSVHVLSFKSRARVAAAQSVTLENPTDKNWFITPVLKGDHWQGAGQLQVRLSIAGGDHGSLVSSASSFWEQNTKCVNKIAVSVLMRWPRAMHAANNGFARCRWAATSGLLMVPCFLLQSQITAQATNNARVVALFYHNARVSVSFPLASLPLPRKVPAKGTAEYTIEFFPLAMTTSSPAAPADTNESHSPAATSGGGGGGRQQQQQDLSKVDLTWATRGVPSHNNTFRKKPE